VKYPGCRPHTHQSWDATIANGAVMVGTTAEAVDGETRVAVARATLVMAVAVVTAGMASGSNSRSITNRHPWPQSTSQVVFTK
jgi:hypothetical protein